MKHWQVENEEQLTDEEVDALNLAATSPSVHFLGFSEIKHKDGASRPPSFINALQRKMFQVYEVMQHLDEPTHMIVLKSRQSGGSTGTGQIVYHHCRRYTARAIVVADRFANSANLFAIFNHFAKTDRFPWATNYAHNTEVGNFSNRSLFEKGTAENPNAGISGTRQAVWKSEVAKWQEGGARDARITNSNLMASLNKNGPNSLEINESTPEGASGLFYELWLGAVTLDEYLAGKKGNGLIKVFAAWFEHEEHSHDGRDGRPAVSEGQARDIMVTLSVREKRGIERYGWTVEQISWRRATLKSDCNGDESLFDMHYPEDEVSCFAVSGRPRFNIDGLNNLTLLANGQTWTYGMLSAQDRDEMRGISFRATPENEAWYMELEEPRVGMRYLVVVDPMSGAENTRGADPDCHAVGVWRDGYREDLGDGTVKRHPVKKVARVVPPCRVDNDRLAEWIVMMSRRYGECIVVVEKNKGELIIDKLRKYGIQLYRFEAVDKLTSKIENYYGWETNEQSRHRAVERLAALIRDTTLQEPKLEVDEHAIMEFRTFIVNSKGRAEARGGCHDDDVLEACIAVETIEGATTYTEISRQRRGPADRDLWKPVK